MRYCEPRPRTRESKISLTKYSSKPWAVTMGVGHWSSRSGNREGSLATWNEFGSMISGENVGLVWQFQGVRRRLRVCVNYNIGTVVSGEELSYAFFPFLLYVASIA
jgi:hypothetical protein